MVGFTGGEKLEAYLKELGKKVERSATVNIGFMGDATEDDGTPVALVAALNEFGVPSRGQPPRPFMRNTIAEHSGSWGDGVAAALKAKDYDANAALDLAADAIAGQIRAAIYAFTTPPLAPSTIAKKSRGGVGNLHGTLGPSKPLVDTGVMANSVTHNVTDGDG